MNAYEFGQHIGGHEKEANKLLRGAIDVGTKAVRGLADDAVRGGKQLVNRGTSATRGYQRGMRQDVVDPLTIPLKDRYKAVPITAKPTGPSRLDAATRAARGQAASLYHGTPGRLAGQAVDAVGGLGQRTMNVMRRGLNKADDMVQGVRGLGPRAAGQRFGDQTIGRTQAAAKNLPEWMGGGSSAMTNARNPLNLAVGAGTGAAGMHYAGKAMGIGSEPTQDNLNAQQMSNQLSAAQHAAVQQSPGLVGMWNSLPIEARYAIGAGVPLALAGAFMGGRGNTGLGAGMGALGLGAAGLGAAGAGMFGDGARRMVGQGANGLYSMLGGGGNPMDQINALSQLSPEFGATMLMGRDPNMSSGQARQMYDFLTHNRNIIEQLMPQLQNASTNGMKQGSALEFGKAAGRCWTGYEPVPGKKPYSNDSCRPVGSKKKDKKEKKARSSAARGTTEMSCTPSARGSSKIIDDKQRSAPSPVPTDATNSQQSHGEKEAAGLVSGLIGAGAKGLAGAARGVGRGVAGGARAVSRATGAAAGELGNAAVNRGAQMANAGAQQMMRGGVGNAVGGLVRGGAGSFMVGAGQAARGAGNVARWAGTQVPGSTAMNAARTAVAMPIAAGATYGAYRATAPAVDPYINSAQQFGSDMANRAGAGLQQAGQAAMAVPRAIGQGVHDAGSAMGDAVGTAYGTARNSVVNTANDVRRGVTNAARTARSYVPNIRNPFYYE